MSNNTGSGRYDGYTTESEIKFINNLGMIVWDTSVGFRQRNRKQLLEGYLMGAGLREEWGLIDKEVVINHARTILNAL